MSDLDDKDLNKVPGDDQPSSSSNGNNKDADDGKTVNDDNHAGAGNPSEEELEWTKLGGRTQDRIRELIRQRNEALAKTPDSDRAAIEMRDKPTNRAFSPEEEEARRKLKDLGVATKEEIVSKEDLQAIRDRMTLDREHDRLSGKYAGSDGRPAYIAEEVEAHAKKTSIFNLEAAYRDLFYEELIDFEAKKRGTSSDRNDSPVTTQPRATTKEQPMSAESIAERLRRPDGREWWEKNRDKVLAAMPDLVGS